MAAWHGPDGAEPSWHDVPFMFDRSEKGIALGGLLLNPSRNDALYLVSCCSRVLEDGRPHAQREIAIRVAAIGLVTGLLEPGVPGFRFRILEVSRGAGGLEQHLAFTSEPFTIDGVPVAPH
jgi:hypothetical protein